MADLLSLAEHLINVKGTKVVNCDLSELKSKIIITLDVVPIETHYISPICGRVCPSYDYASKDPRLWRANDWNGTQVMLRFLPDALLAQNTRLSPNLYPGHTTNHVLLMISSS